MDYGASAVASADSRPYFPSQFEYNYPAYQQPRPYQQPKWNQQPVVKFTKISIFI